MREIKFRARNAGVPRCWIYGYFLIVGGVYYIINNNGQFQVIADTQNQFTGRKDKNGKEIYEEDKVTFQIGYYKAKRNQTVTDIVIFEASCFKTKKYKMPISAISNCEVVGNISENPESKN